MALLFRRRLDRAERRRQDAGATGQSGARDEASDLDAFAVGENVDRAVCVGAERANACSFEPI